MTAASSVGMARISSSVYDKSNSAQAMIPSSQPVAMQLPKVSSPHSVPTVVSGPSSLCSQQPLVCIYLEVLIIFFLNFYTNKCLSLELHK